MTTDDLSAPLGQGKAVKPRRALTITLPQAIAGVLSIFIAVFAGWAMIVNDPFGGEPMVVVRADPGGGNGGKVAADKDRRPSDTAANERPSRYDGPAIESAPPSAPAVKTITIIDGTSGQRQEVVIPTPSEPKVEQAATRDDVDAQLAEQSQHGPLPKVAADGSRASEAYARPVKAIAGKPNAPRVAIVVGGLGISASSTSDALNKLSADVTLAFMPYATNVAELATRARGAGHEILLQVPMEPFDYPDNDPGPRTLLTSLDAAQNIDRLQWLMGRLQGYVGIANYMGARFTASEKALAPIMREAGKRGLLVLDDGTSQRSVAPQVAAANSLAFARADVTIDAVPSQVDVDRALARLERIARDRGVAVGVTGALPVAIDRIAKWAKAAEGRGILLVPISAIANRAKSS